MSLALAGCTGTITGPGGDESGVPGGPAPGTPGGPGGGSGGGTSSTGEPLDCSGTGAPSVGVTPLRRLTRSQYSHTIRDLLGLSGDHAARLSLDEKVGLFYSNANNPVTELLVEQYMTTADELAAQAVATQMTTLVPCDPAVEDPAACGAKFVDSFGLKAFRRPLLPEEQTLMVTLFNAGLQDGGFNDGVERVVSATLQSPQLLYHVELGALPAGSAETVALDQYILGSRLSYFLWDSTPDAELLRAAGAGELSTPEALRLQAQRLLDDPRAAETIAGFHKQWLGTDHLDDLEKDAEQYPDFSPELKAAMLQETARFSDFVIRSGDGLLDTLLTAPFSFLDPPLAELYGVTLPAGHDPLTPVDLDPTQRSGLLTMAGVMAVHSHANQGSPIRRGKMVRENILCQPLQPPPPGADITPPEPDPNASTRERFEQHRTEPTCAGCHSLIDPLGFAFENYDGIGTFRTMEAGKLIDASGELTATDIDGTFVGAGELSKKLATSPQVRDCLAQHWFNYAFGRTRGDADGCSMTSLTGAFAASNNVRDLLLALVTTDAFRYGRFNTEAP
ncbi:MAG TPA: DUF1592 domain-containing protein [Polyangiaceae bacterium]|nr:DUF1592 domain-containing protein [Polyangiaceae bacterium]